MIFFGIDPGQYGAIVSLWGDEATHNPAPISEGALNVKEVRDYFAVWRHTHDATKERWLAIVEQPPYGFGPRTSIKTIVSLHRSAEAWRCLLALNGCELLTVTAMQWKRHFGLVKKPKAAACAEVKRWFGWELDPKNKTDEGIADAALLALYGRQRWGA